ncbi:MAG: TonB-dependent receptor family protein [Steroidobacteraceae bacterium]
MHFAIHRRPAQMLAVASAIFLRPAGAAEPVPKTMDTVVVTAERQQDALEAERAVTPGAVTNLDGETLYERNVTQLSEMLRYVPGVYSESYNGNDDVFYSSRGSNLDATDYDKNGVKFLQDGLPVSAADGNNHNRALDPLGARYATFAHGANALAYGASTLGGAMDFISPTARNTRSSVFLSGGSFGDWGGRATMGGVAGDFDGLVTAETRQRDGYRDHSSQDRKAVYANLGWAASDDVSTRLYANYVDFDTNLPRELSPAQYHADPEQARADAILGDHGKEVQSLRFALKTTVAELAGGTLEVGASYERQELFHPIVSTPFFSLLIDTTHKDAGAMVRYQRDAGSHGLLFGVNYGRSTVTGGNFSNEGGQPGFLMWTSDDKASSLEVFALDRWKFAPDWTLVYGAQFTMADRNVSGFEADYDEINPRLGVIRNLGEESEWYASVSRVYEAPTTFELTDDYNGGSTPLAAMNGTVVETGLRGASAAGETRLNWDVSIYYTALRDEILSRDDPDAPGTSLSANIDKTTHAGIEALFGASIALGAGGHRIEPLISASYNAFTFDSDPAYGDNRLPSAPRYFARGEILYRNNSGFSAGPTFDVIGAKYVDFSNTYRLGSYGLLGARAAYSTENWEVFAEARNLLDRDYVATVLVKDVVSPTSEMLFPGAPRSYYAGIRFQF